MITNNELRDILVSIAAIAVLCTIIGAFLALGIFAVDLIKASL
jgi:hypothetical protein